MSDEVVYPTEEELERIRTWAAGEITELMVFVGGLWYFKEWGWRQLGKIYWLSTGGWSGNEDLIGALQDNQMFWALYWQQSRRGGHYIFAPMTWEVIDILDKTSNVMRQITDV